MRVPVDRPHKHCKWDLWHWANHCGNLAWPDNFETEFGFQFERSSSNLGEWCEELTYQSRSGIAVGICERTYSGMPST